MIEIPVSFRRRIDVTFYVADTSAQTATANVFDNDGVVWNTRTVSAYFIPGTVQKYDLQAMGYRFLGECSIKLDTKYAGLVQSGSHVQIGNVQWNYKQIEELGTGFGNDRIILALTRKKSA